MTLTLVFGDEPSLFYIRCNVFTYKFSILMAPSVLSCRNVLWKLSISSCHFLVAQSDSQSGQRVVVNLDCCECNVPTLSHIPLLELFSSRIKLLKNFISLIIRFSPCLFSLSDRLLLALVLHPYPLWGL